MTCTSLYATIVFSKSLYFVPSFVCLCSYRVGYSASATDIAKGCSKLQSQMTSCASSIGICLSLQFMYASILIWSFSHILFVGQHSANIALTQVPSAWMEERRKELLEKRDLAYDMITSIPGWVPLNMIWHPNTLIFMYIYVRMGLCRVKCPKPTGAFYLLPDVSFYYNKSTKSGKQINNPDDLCLELLREHQVRLDLSSC